VTAERDAISFNIAPVKFLLCRPSGAQDHRLVTFCQRFFDPASGAVLVRRRAASGYSLHESARTNGDG